MKIKLNFIAWLRVASLFVLILTTTSRTAVADESALSAGKGAFVSQCIFENGAKAMLIQPIGSSNFFVLVRDKEDVNDLSVIRIGDDSKLSIETNGGLGKQTALDRIFRELSKGRFAFVSQAEFQNVVKAPISHRCQLPYPFSP